MGVFDVTMGVFDVTMGVFDVTMGVFDVTMGVFDGAEVCELVGTYLLSSIVVK